MRACVHTLTCSVTPDYFVIPWTVTIQAPPWNFPGKNTGVGCHSFLQGMFPTQGPNPHLLRLQVDSLTLSHLGCLIK